MTPDLKKMADGALAKYGSHLLDCEDADTGKCTCGYRDALRPAGDVTNNGL
jgi:hypothetical protein